MRRSDILIDPRQLLSELEQRGAYWRRSDGGSWLLAGPALPGYLIDQLAALESRVLVAAIVERYEVSTNKSNGH